MFTTPTSTETTTCSRTNTPARYGVSLSGGNSSQYMLSGSYYSEEDSSVRTPTVCSGSTSVRKSRSTSTSGSRSATTPATTTTSTTRLASQCRLLAGTATRGWLR
ncbi:MAG: hypothetical protein ACLRMJ_08470 [Alistipes finegoldii]